MTTKKKEKEGGKEKLCSLGPRRPESERRGAKTGLGGYLTCMEIEEKKK